MTTTTFVPDWDATRELREYSDKYRDKDRVLVKFRGHFTPTRLWRYDELVFEFKERFETRPPGLEDVPMKAIVLTQPNAAVTEAIDGYYVEGDITARVETRVQDGTHVQHIRVEGRRGTSLEELNDWFDCLVHGEKRYSRSRRSEERKARETSHIR